MLRVLIFTLYHHNNIIYTRMRGEEKYVRPHFNKISIDA